MKLPLELCLALPIRWTVIALYHCLHSGSRVNEAIVLSLGYDHQPRSTRTALDIKLHIWYFGSYRPRAFHPRSSTGKVSTTQAERPAYKAKGGFCPNRPPSIQPTV